MRVKQYWIWLFFAVLLADTIALAIPWNNSHFILKLLLMPILMTGLLANKQLPSEKNWRRILAGLVIAWAGDTLLLFSADSNLFFALGLACFLLTHIAYITYFFRYGNGSRRWLAAHPILTFLAVLYAIVLFGFLLPGLHQLMLPVAAYTLVITIMLLQALSSQPFVSPKSRKFFVGGAVSFILSDSMLAWDKFHNPFLFADSAIIVTYGVAQFLIVKGAILNSDENQTIEDQETGLEIASGV